MPNNNQPRLAFKPVEQNDLPLLYRWFQEPHVKQWWPVPEKEEEFFTQFLARIRSSTTFPFLVFADDIPFAYIQYYYLTDEKESKTSRAWMPGLPETTIGTDQFIGDPQHLGKGYGARMLSGFIEFLKTREPWVTTVIVDPDPRNIVAIKCYQKVGFASMGAYQTPWGEALLMKYDIADTLKTDL